MKSYPRRHFSGIALSQQAVVHHTGERTNLAEGLADIAEYDERKQYLPDGYPSTLEFCIEQLKLRRPIALKRIRVARLALQFPQILPAIEDGRLHVSGIVLLSAKLTAENGADLLTAAEFKTDFEIEEMLAARPRTPAVLPLLAAVEEASRTTDEAASHSTPMGPSGPPTSAHSIQETDADMNPQLAALKADDPVIPVSVRRLPGRVKPRPHGEYEVQYYTMRAGYDRLRRAQQLCPGTVGEVIEKALDLLIRKIEKRKFGATSNPRPRRKSSGTSDRQIPAEVRREVVARDGERCTFTSDSGHRCTATMHLEFDHVVPVALGGKSTAGNLRLLCRAHNQFVAEETFGAGFMERKREESRRTTEMQFGGTGAPGS